MIIAEQIKAMLGNQTVQQIAQKLGIDTGKAAESLTHLLPQVIDTLTHAGSIEPDGPTASRRDQPTPGIWSRRPSRLSRACSFSQLQPTGSPATSGTATRPGRLLAASRAAATASPASSID